VLAGPRGRHAYLNGDDDERRRSLEQALHSDVDVVWLARGGYGLTRFVSRLEAPRGHAPIVCGFSDATALFAHLSGSGVRCVHGPLATTLVDETDESFSWCLDVLKRKARGHRIPVRAEDDLDVEGWIFAGNLCVLAHLVGTPALPSLDGALLVLEETGERPYRIDRMLTQLKDSGALAGVRGVITGYLTNCGEPPSSSAVRDPAPTALEVIRERLRSIEVPLAHGISVGHEHPNMALPQGARARLTKDGLEILEDLPP
jgi:muramoyltetrapeptide carboxypeptidase